MWCTDLELIDQARKPILTVNIYIFQTILFVSVEKKSPVALPEFFRFSVPMSVLSFDEYQKNGFIDQAGAFHDERHPLAI